ncbi:MAG: hypothetical protein KDK75_10565 [Alphaproteobacteria bacterium]|nr:hypothetical protein [Alphaproteobacteria bacterium]
MRSKSGDFEFGCLLGFLLGLVCVLMLGAAIEVVLYPKGVVYDYQSLIAGMIAAAAAFGTIWQIRQQMVGREREIAAVLEGRRRANRAMLEASSVAIRDQIKSVCDSVWSKYDLMEQHLLPAEMWSMNRNFQIPNEFLAVLRDNIECEDRERNQVLTKLLSALTSITYEIWAWNEKLFEGQRTSPRSANDIAHILVNASEAYVRLDTLLSNADALELVFDDVYPHAYLLSGGRFDPNRHTHFHAIMRKRFGESEKYITGAKNAHGK